MYSKVLVGVVEGDRGRDAVTLARELAGGSFALGCVHSGYALNGRSASPAFEAKEREQAAELLEQARAYAGVDAELCPIAAAGVGEGLHRLTDSVGADLLVVGSTRSSRLGRVLLGDHTREAINGARCAVAIAPAGYAQHPHLMREVGVAYNETPESRYALELARAIAAEHDAKVSVLEAVDVPAYAYAGVAPLEIPVDQLLEAARERLSGLEGVEPHVVYGAPEEELPVYSASVDLLVIGSRSYGPLGRLVHGSTSNHLLRSSRCPLLIVPRAVSAAAAVAGPPALARNSA